MQAEGGASLAGANLPSAGGVCRRDGREQVLITEPGSEGAWRYRLCIVITRQIYKGSLPSRRRPVKTIFGGAVLESVRHG